MPDRFNLTNSTNQSCIAFKEICPDFTQLVGLNPREYIMQLWTLYEEKVDRNKNLNGKVFELIIGTLLINQNIKPFYTQSKVAFVPNVEYDIILYTEDKNPIVLSLKTSLRERYKQADLEAYVLKNVHRKSESYIITMNSSEANNINRKIEKGELLALNKIIDLDNIDNFITQLKKHTFCESESINIITGGNLVR